MKVMFRKAVIEDADILLEIQKKSFQESLELYKDYETNPANESAEKIAYKIRNHFYYVITADDIMIGGIHAYKKDNNHCYLNRIYIHPDYENKGIGSKAMEFLLYHEDFRDVELWTLDTPHKSYKNHSFYEKLGFVRTGEVKEVSAELKLIHYEKVMKK